MVKEVVWTNKAITTYNKIIDYLAENWEPKVADNFVIKLKKTLSILEKGNIKFRKSKKNYVFEVLIIKHNLLIYKESNTKIELLQFYDTRQHPKKKKI